METFSVSSVFSKSWEFFKQNWLSLLLGVIAINILVDAIFYIFGYNEDIVDIIYKVIDKFEQGDNKEILKYLNSPEFAIYKSQIQRIEYIDYFLKLIFYVGYFSFILKKLKGNEQGSLSIDHWKLPISTYVVSVLCLLIINFVVGVGFLFCIIPGIYLSLRTTCVFIAYLDHPERGITHAFDAAWNMTRGHVVTLFFIYLILFFLDILGLIFCCVGIIIPAILSMILPVVIYQLLSQKEETSE